jgi:hypothetical protein
MNFDEDIIMPQVNDMAMNIGKDWGKAYALRTML